MNTSGFRELLGMVCRGTAPLLRRIGWVLATSVLAVIAIGCSKGTHADWMKSGQTDEPDGGVAACRTGKEGCPCAYPNDQYGCGRLVRKDGDYVTCTEGLSTCKDGVWSACEGDRLVTRSVQSVAIKSGTAKRFLSVRAPCEDVCDPYCGQVDSEPSDVVDAGGIAQLADGGLILEKATGTGSGPGSGTKCVGLQCEVKACGGNITATRLTGRVYDPAGKVPLYNATVYVPVDGDLTKLPALSDAWTDGVSCDRCDATSVRAVSMAQTDTTGSFTLEAVPATTNVPLVVQMGKWRRTIVLSSIIQCQDNTITDNCTASDKSLCMARLPRSRFDGYNPANGSYSYLSATGANGKADIPRIAMISGSADPFQCMLLKAGLDPNEFGSYDKYPERRIHYYHSNDNAGSKLMSAYGNQIGGNVVWNSAANLDKYDVVIPACEGAAIDKASTAPAGVNPYRNLIDYANKGGRVFTTHWGYIWLQYPYTKSKYPDWMDVATWIGSSARNPQDPLTASLNTSFPKGRDFSTWLSSVSATTTAGQLKIAESRQNLTSVGANTQSWMTAINSNYGNSLFNLLFTFNTPYAALQSEQCGRIVYSDFHVSAKALTSSNSCYTASDCGFGATCSGTPPTSGTCSEPCALDSDCSAGYTCTGTPVAGTCTPATCSATKPCSGGAVCKDGKCQCTRGDQCGSDSCTLPPGTCSATSCTTDAACGPTQYCSGATPGTCTVDTCNNWWECSSLNCVGGKCACTTGSQCSSNVCLVTPASCAAATCNNDGTTCGTSEVCNLNATGTCEADQCSNSKPCANGRTCKSNRCVCSKDSHCGGNGRTCVNGACLTKGCNDDDGCLGWEHCRIEGTCGPAPCSSTGKCAAGTCESDGKCHCTKKSQCASNQCNAGSGAGMCGGTAAQCSQESDCGTAERCSNGISGTCAARPCSASNPCPSGMCGSDGTCKCIGGSDCATGATCSSIAGSCGEKACYSAEDCGAIEQCTGGMLGTCTKSCSTNTDCPNGETCSSGKCIGCTSSAQCQAEKYTTSCVGASGGVKGTCSPYTFGDGYGTPGLFPVSCKQGNLTAQEKALEFMFFDLTACVTPDGYEPSGPVNLYTAASFTPPDYVASCAEGLLPRWREVRWRAEIAATASSDISPASITFAAQSGADAASLLPPTPLTVATAATSTQATRTDFAPIDTGAGGTGVFNAASPVVYSDNILRLTITLTPSSDYLTTPVLLDWTVVYDCVPNK